jgi:hypothetical protein
MSVESYRKQRSMIAPVELARHHGKWAAFSGDGAHVIASCESLEPRRLETAVRAAGQDPQNVVYEFVDTDEMIIGGAELQCPTRRWRDQMPPDRMRRL